MKKIVHTLVVISVALYALSLIFGGDAHIPDATPTGARAGE